MKEGKRKSSRLLLEAAGAGSSRDTRKLDLDGEAAQHQERNEDPEDAGSEREEEPVAGEGEGEEGEEEEEKDEVPEVVHIEKGDGDSVAKKVKPQLAAGFYEIETVRRRRTRKGQVQYLIKWRGWPETANTWEPEKNLLSCTDIIDAYEESLKSGKLRSTRKRKRKFGATQTQPKKKQQQRSPAAATYNVPAVRVRIIEEPTPSPPLNVLKATNRVDSNGSELNSKVDKVVNGNGLRLREQNELNLKLSELKGAMSTNGNPVDISGNGLANGFPKVNGAEFYQSDRCTGAKKRKSGCVRRFKRETTSAVKDDIQDALAGGPLATFMQDGSHNHELVAGDLVCKNKSDDSKDGYTITQLVNPVGYKASFSNDMLDVSVTFVAKRSDGNLVLVDNKFLKMNNPLLLINFYEQNMRYNPSE
ncbi:chromo domain protein LHP1 isoform X2 [Solanum tuberosum]|uniref:chromo domain protein LHP1 isoform X2 n=1 Tax=Solanum tuberosum TaxID=4113 RepID=UPI00073A3B8D|nr:PREDICTED: chromo domain protein LHP1 isoform X2 [Solanum tuberosum]